MFGCDKYQFTEKRFHIIPDAVNEMIDMRRHICQAYIKNDVNRFQWYLFQVFTEDR